MSYVTYPKSFQCPQIKPYSLGVDMGLVRTPMQGGNNRQRRQYRHMPHIFRLEFVMEALDLGTWQQWINSFAYDYFILGLESMWSGNAGTITSPHIVRFISDLEVENVVYGWVRVRVQAELSPNQYALAGPGILTDAWIIGGTPAAPSADTIIAGTPAAPSMPEWISAGSPQNPAAIL